MDDIIKALTKPEKLYSYSDIISNGFLEDHPDINETGIYAWYFKEIPPHVTDDDDYPMVIKNNKTLLYIGKSGSVPLQKRINTHYTGKARRSTLRMSLSVLFHEQMPDLFCESGSKKGKYYYHLPENGEEDLNKWMEKNACVCWIAKKNPTNDEKGVIGKISPPFNIIDGKHSFREKLNRMRCDAKNKARQSLIANH
ncbi:MAG: GIY-YIG nuclease family protein [Candidatus Halichondribacter symbioticus]